MSETGTKRRAGKELRRAALRAFNGAMLGMLMGGLLGAVLGAVFAHFVVGVGAWIIGTIYGVPPGAFAGILIGTTMVVRDPRRGVAAGILTGTGVAVLYAWLLGWSYTWDPVAASIVASGIIGGLALSVLLRWIRRRWSWWTRWENG